MISQSILVFFLLFAATVFADTLCDDWATYGNEKCFKLDTTLQNYTEAINTCVRMNSTLVTISSANDQREVEAYLFEKLKTVENVWIGLKYTNNLYKWNNQSDVSFTKWAQHSPKNSTDLCVEIVSDDDFLGEWSDVSCARKNLALCEIIPKITLSQLKSALISAQTQLKQNNLQQSATLHSFEDTIIHLKTTIHDISFKLDSEKLSMRDIIQPKPSLGNSDKPMYATIKESLVESSELLSLTNQLAITVRDLDTKLEVKSREIEIFFNQSYLKTFTESNTRKALIYPTKAKSVVSHSEAMELCLQNNATLVDIESEVKQNFVLSYLKQLQSDYHDYWIGGYSGSGGKYKWLNSGDEFQYSNWNPGNPYDNDTYIYIYSNDGSMSGFWFSTSNAGEFNVFCEVILNF